ncbi:uncharacterized protein LOC132265928 [Phlebotomus argentipes]|uniref:uncharacterized protein LOC132265928 n=1 Tax=Phlebotomus argentipes TaxID=94469 RepID=UPI002892FA3B|nr:uncharacterized protein LOC132265928 [Phlebotomus argentipes]
MTVVKMLETRQSFMKFFLIFSLTVALLFYLFNVETLKSSYTRLLRFTADPLDEMDPASEAYFVNTVGCKMPKFPIFDAHIQRFIADPTQIHCSAGITASDATHVWIKLNATELHALFNVTDPSLLSCSYQSFVRKSDMWIRFHNKVTPIMFGERHRVAPGEEFIKVTCDNFGLGEIYQDFHFFVPERTASADAVPAASRRKVNVIVIGIDSVSRLNFRRQLRKTTQVLLEELDAIEMEGYTKVGDNTYPNLMPVLSGLEASELESICMPEKNSTYDNCHFIWRDFAKRGYLTAFAEDIGYLGLFNYFKKGFRNQPTDYYTRPIITAMERQIAYHKMGNVFFCLGSKTPFEILFDYIGKFVQSLQRKRFFGFFWTSSFTHDYLNMPRLIDDELVDFFRRFSDGALSNDTVLIVMSDHGLRWGSFRSTYQGMMEERQPFMYSIFPKWFHAEFPRAMRHFRRNSRRLTSHFDLHEMLRDLSRLEQLEDVAVDVRATELAAADPLPRGVSLFLPIPATRTCDAAGISPHWCTCHEKQSVPTIDQGVLRVARFVLRELNDCLVDSPQCARLHLNSILEATRASLTPDAAQRVPATGLMFDLTVRLRTKPGMAEFEATVRVRSDEDMELTGPISRTNLYGRQSACVSDPQLKLYCYCGKH